MNSTARIGIVGVGQMGLAMALRLRDGGCEVGVCDIDGERERLAQDAGAEAFATPAALAAACDVVIVAVVDAAQCESVIFGTCGIATALARGGCVLLCPTLGPASSEIIAARLAEAATHCIEAPMSGGPARARDGSMSLMVACDDAVFERHRDLLAMLSSRLFRVGTRIGDGARTKLVNNLLAAVNLAGAAEVLALAERVGLDAARTLEIVEQSSGQSWIGSDRMRRALAGDLAPRAATTLLAKDTRLALAMASEAGVALPLGAAAAARFVAAVAAGYGDLDDACLLELGRAARPS